MKIKSIKITSVRGIKDLELELKGKSLIIYGENGTGKSSIVDAFELFFTGEIEHITNVKGLNLKHHCTHIHSSPKNVNITITCDPGPISATRILSKQINIPTQLKEYFNNTRQNKFILRRHQILEFIHSPPAQRFEAIGEILGIASLNNLEELFMETREHFERLIQSKQNEINKILIFLSEYINGSIPDQKTILHVLNCKLNSEGFKKLDSFDLSDIYIKDIMENIKNKDNEIKTNYERILVQFNLIDFTQHINKLLELKEVFLSYISQNEQDNLVIVDFLKKGKEIIENNSNSYCPFCELQIDKNNVLNNVTKRVNTMNFISNTAYKIRDMVEYLTNELTNINSNINNVIDELNKIENDFTDEVKNLISINDRILELNNKLKNILTSKFWIDESELESAFKSFEIIRTELNKKIRYQLDQSNQSEQDKILHMILLLQTVKLKHEEIEIRNRELKKLKNFFNVADIIYSTYSEVKKSKIQEIHEDIQKDIDRFYSFIHKDEEHNDIKLMIDLKKKGSTEIKVNSYNNYIDPRAFQSEGHLDSLGLCIFLAFVKKFNISSNLIILDDIVTTIDSQHRIKICELIYQNFSDKQLIITTHDNVWFEQLITFQNKYDIKNKFLNLKIDSWDINTGPKFSKYMSREERIKNKLESNDKNSAGNEIRQYLEHITKELCENIHADVPFKNDGKYMVEELLTSSKKRLNKLIKDVTWKNEILGIFKEIESVKFLSNILSHDNLEILQISINEIRYLYTVINNLENKFKCTSCFKNIEYDRNGSLIRCVNNKCSKRLIIETN